MSEAILQLITPWLYVFGGAALLWAVLTIVLRLICDRREQKSKESERIEGWKNMLTEYAVADIDLERMRGVAGATPFRLDDVRRSREKITPHGYTVEEIRNAVRVQTHAEKMLRDQAMEEHISKTRESIERSVFLDAQESDFFKNQMASIQMRAITTYHTDGTTTLDYEPVSIYADDGPRMARLGGIPHAEKRTTECPTCGAGFRHIESGTCAYCGNRIRLGEIG